MDSLHTQAHRIFGHNTNRRSSLNPSRNNRLVFDLTSPNHHDSSSSSSSSSSTEDSISSSSSDSDSDDDPSDMNISSDNDRIEIISVSSTSTYTKNQRKKSGSENNKHNNKTSTNTSNNKKPYNKHAHYQCHVCKQYGHIAIDCPKRIITETKTTVTTQNSKKANNSPKDTKPTQQKRKFDNDEHDDALERSHKIQKTNQSNTVATKNISPSGSKNNNSKSIAPSTSSSKQIEKSNTSLPTTSSSTTQHDPKNNPKSAVPISKESISLSSMTVNKDMSQTSNYSSITDTREPWYDRDPDANKEWNRIRNDKHLSDQAKRALLQQVRKDLKKKEKKAGK